MKTARAAYALAFSAALLSALSACSYHTDKQGSQATAGGANIDGSKVGFSDVQTAILAPKCISCHTHDHSWMSNYQTVTARLGDIKDRIQASGQDAMPPAGALPLTPSEKAALLAWIARGGPLQPGQNNPIPPTPAPTPGPTEPVPPSLGFAYVRQAVLAPKCISCHHHAKDFATFADTTPLIKDIQERIHSTDPDDKMPRPTAPQLTAAELQLLDDWINAGAPENGPAIPPLSTDTATSTATVTVTVTETATSTTTASASATVTETATETSTSTSTAPGSPEK